MGLNWQKYPENLPKKPGLYLCKSSALGSRIYKVMDYCNGDYLYSQPMRDNWQKFEITHWCEIENPKKEGV